MSVLNRFGYMLWYLRNPPWDTGITPPELLEFLKTQPAGRALDMGCGTGTNVITLSRLGWQAAGIDFVPQAINRARKKAADAEVMAVFRIGNVTALDDFSGPFDLVLDLGCYHSLSAKEKGDYLHQLERVMAQGGAWFLYSFLQDPGSGAFTGLSDLDLEHIRKSFVLRSRINGFDRGNRRSAYFIFEKLKPGASN